MFTSRKDKESKNLNRVVVQVGSQQTNKDILDFVVFYNGKEYTLNELFEKILTLETENQKIIKALKVHESSRDSQINLITKAAELLSAKVAALEADVADLKIKCKYL